MEYKKGDKFIIEIDEILNNCAVLEDENVTVYKMKGFNALTFDKNGLKKLTRYSSAAENAIFDLNDSVCELNQLNKQLVDKYTKCSEDLHVIIGQVLSEIAMSRRVTEKIDYPEIEKANLKIDELEKEVADLKQTIFVETDRNIREIVNLIVSALAADSFLVNDNTEVYGKVINHIVETRDSYLKEISNWR